MVARKRPLDQIFQYHLSMTAKQHKNRKIYICHYHLNIFWGKKIKLGYKKSSLLRIWIRNFRMGKHCGTWIAKLAFDVAERLRNALFFVQPRRNILHSESLWVFGQAFHFNQGIWEISILKINKSRIYSNQFSPYIHKIVIKQQTCEKFVSHLAFHCNWL